MQRYLAIDIGASSGRHIVGWEEKGKMITAEVYRFPNGVKEEEGHFIWDIECLEKEVKKGIEIAQRIYPEIYSLAIDTWAVDYVLMKGGKEIRPVYAYRDKRTENIVEEVHKKISFSKLYEKTGCQFQPFNSIYQLYADKLTGRLEEADDLLMIPEYLLYKLCGVKVREYTNATTTGLVSVKTEEYDEEIIDLLKYPKKLFPKLAHAGQIVGEYKGIQCILCATHDTASAVEGIELTEEDLYISSGTWSLLGTKTKKPITDKESQKTNFSNEGGIGYNRYQKNIMGMWLVNKLRRELCPEKEFDEIVQQATESHCSFVVDVDAPEFLAPSSMKTLFDEKTENGLKTLGDYFCCAYRSLAKSYQKAVEQIEQNTGRQFRRIMIVGGGAKNQFLNHLTEEATGKEIVALPIEATVSGNLKQQMEDKP